MQMAMKYKEDNNLRKQKYRSLQGSITVEAAFVMPMVIFTIFALIYLSFYLHDMCRIQGIVDMTLHKAGLTLKHEADIGTGKVAFEGINDRGVFYLLVGSTEEEERQVQNYLQQELTGGLFLAQITSIKVDAGKFKLQISVGANMTVSLPLIKYLFAPLSHTEIAGEYPIHNPAETIRRCDVILDTASKIKGVDELKEKIEKFFQQGK